MFDIIIDKKERESEFGGKYYPGEIVINDFRETFQLPSGYWEINDYKRSWLSSLEEGMLKKSHAALAVSMGDEENTNFIFTWVVYFKPNEARVQNIMMFMEEMPGFSSEKINEYVNEYEEYDDEGRKISEWYVDLQSISEYISRLKAELV